MFRRWIGVLLALSISVSSAARADTLDVVFWNLENFFDWHADGVSQSEADFSSSGVRRWTKKRFYTKCGGIAKVLLMIADRQGRLPDAVGFAEVENSFVLKQLINSTVLRKLDYRVVHFESPDHRGIDCGLIYRASSLHLAYAAPKHIYDSAGAVVPTRDILLVRFDSLAVLVNHHPSKVGGGDDRRAQAMSRMNFLCDSLMATGCRAVISMGDFNEDQWHSDTHGTIKYNGAWEKIDGCFIRGDIEVEETIFQERMLLEEDRNWGGMKPRRTYVGLRWNAGLSDHLPVTFRIIRK